MRRRHVLAVVQGEVDCGNLQRSGRLQGCEVHVVPVDGGTEPSLEAMIEAATRRVESAGIPVDAVVGFGGFPAAAVASVLGERLAVPGPPLEAIAACSHAVWMRLVGLRASTPHILPFRILDPTDHVALDELDVELPCSIRPVNGLAAREVVRVSTREDFEPALARMRDVTAVFATALEELLARVDLPPELTEVGARHCIVEPTVGGHHARVEAYVFEGEVHTYGIADCGVDPSVSAAAQVRYPSHLPFPVQDEMRGLVGRLGRALGLGHGTFGVDLLFDRVGDGLWFVGVTPSPLLEDLPLFEMVDGTSGGAVALDLALGRSPTYVHGRGPFGCAARFAIAREGAGEPETVTLGGADEDELCDAFARQAAPWPSDTSAAGHP